MTEDQQQIDTIKDSINRILMELRNMDVAMWPVFDDTRQELLKMLNETFQRVMPVMVHMSRAYRAQLLQEFRSISEKFQGIIRDQIKLSDDRSLVVEQKERRHSENGASAQRCLGEFENRWDSILSSEMLIYELIAWKHSLGADEAKQIISTQVSDAENEAKRAKKTVADIISVNSQANEHAEGITDILTSMQQKQDAALAILQKMQKFHEEQVTTASKERFGSLFARHSSWAWVWLAISAILVVGIPWFVVSYYGENWDMQSPKVNLLRNVAGSTIMVGFLLALFRASLNKYNQERHLQILYAHRAEILRNYQSFEDAFFPQSNEGNIEARNAFKIEILKYVFSDPATGYLKEAPSQDHTVTTVLKMLNGKAGG